jgi:hypothetical protein
VRRADNVIAALLDAEDLLGQELLILHYIALTNEFER